MNKHELALLFTRGT